jgi:NADPH:quinone reductase-like Zn-dependent oxidoreductase
MKIVQFASFGPPHQVADCVEVPDPSSPAGDEVTVAVEAFPINPADLLTISGKYAIRPPLPATPGAEAVGRVVAAGAGVTTVVEGDRVLLLSRENWVQQRKVKEDQALKLPVDADILQLAMLKVNPATALCMLRDYVSLAPGDWVIQDAANSGVGASLIAIAKADGIKTVNVVRRPELVEPLTALGADVVVVDGDDLADRVREATGGADIKLAIDAIAGDICLRLADCLGQGGTIVNYGMLSDRPCQVSPYQVVFKGINLTGFWLATVLGQMSRDEAANVYAGLAHRIAQGQLKVDVEATYPIEEIQAALEHAGREGRGGKILVTPNEEL